MKATQIWAQRIRDLNDEFRRTFLGGRVVFTASVAAMAADRRRRLVEKVQSFSQFPGADDPYGEHDFGAFEDEGVRFFWKIDLYDQTMKFGSPDAADPAVTVRVLTVMRADEY